jgi:hypothetical protein
MGIRIISAISTWPFPALFLHSTFPARFTYMGYESRLTKIKLHLYGRISIDIGSKQYVHFVSLICIGGYAGRIKEIHRHTTTTLYL